MPEVRTGRFFLGGRLKHPAAVLEVQKLRLFLLQLPESVVWNSVEQNRKSSRGQESEQQRPAGVRKGQVAFSQFPRL